MHPRFFLYLTVFLLVPILAMAEVMSVSFSGTEMRSAPNALSSKVIVKVPVNTPLTVLEKGSEYYKVSDYRGRNGWVHHALLSDKPCIVVTSDRANVRQGPGTNHPVSFQLSKGDAGRLITKQDNWYQIQSAKGQTGWIADFLTWGQ